MISKNSKVYYIDTYSQNSFHEIFNASLLVMCSKIFQEVSCQLNHSSLLAIKKTLKDKFPSNIQTKSVFVIKGSTPYHLVLRYLLSAILNIFYLIKAPKNAIIIFPYNNVFGIRLLNLANKILKRKIIVFCHGEMECVASDINKKGIISRLVTSFSRNFFKNNNITISNNLYFSFMGEKILNNLTPHVSKQILSNSIIVDHPYTFEDYNIENQFIQTSNDKIEKDKLNIGTVGIFSMARGLKLFYEWVKTIPKPLKNQLKINVIGSVSGYYKELDDLNVEILNNSKELLLERDIFENAIKKLDYILFFYDMQSYKYTPSGAVLDALKFNKPIISLKNDYFDYMFEKYGNFGYLLDNTDEFTTTLLKIINGEEYHTFNFDSIKSQLNPEKLFIQFEKELKRIKYL